MYAGKDPLSGRELRFRKTRRTEVEAQIELGKLLALARTGRQPDSDVTVAELLDQYVLTGGWDRLYEADQPRLYPPHHQSPRPGQGSVQGRCRGLASSGREPQAASFKVGAQGAEGQGKGLELIESDGLAEDLLDCCVPGGLCPGYGRLARGGQREQG